MVICHVLTFQVQRAQVPFFVMDLSRKCIRMPLKTDNLQLNLSAVAELTGVNPGAELTGH